MVAIDELGAIVASAHKEKELIALLTRIALKGRLGGVILVVVSQFASVGYYPKCGKVTTSDKNSSRSAPAELVRMVPDF